MSMLSRCLVCVLACLCLPLGSARAASPKAAGKPAAEVSAQPKGEPLELSGRVMAGLAQVFIKDPAQGYFLVQGVNLAQHAGRHITAKALVVGKDGDYRIVRILSFRIHSPDDESPGAGGEVRALDESKVPAKRKK
jgi:hypothetical protein